MVARFLQSLMQKKRRKIWIFVSSTVLLGYSSRFSVVSGSSVSQLLLQMTTIARLLLPLNLQE